MKKINIAIIIPMFNAESSIARCISSIVQSLNDNYRFEVVIVDDGSTDSSFNIASSFANSYPFIKVIKTENSGNCAARNIGFKNINSDTDWVMFVDSDDIVASAFFSSVDKTLLSTKSLDTIVFDYFESDCGVDILKRNCDLPNGIYNSFDLYRLERLCLTHIGFTGQHNIGLVGSPWAKLYNFTSLNTFYYSHKRLFRENIKRGGDVLFNFEFFSTMKAFAYCSVPSYVYTVNSSSVSHSSEAIFDKAFNFMRTLNEEIHNLDIEQEKYLPLFWHCGVVFINDILNKKLNSYSDFRSAFSCLFQKERFFSDSVQHSSYSMWGFVGKVKLLLLKHRLYHLLFSLLKIISQVKEIERDFKKR